jgi:tetratricopeptide (TPR) repeat protein
LSNSGKALMSLGRPAEAVEAFRRAVEERRLIVADGPITKGGRRSLGNEFLDLAEAERALGRPAEAAATLLKLRDLWDDDPDGLYELARNLALCIPIVAEGHAEPIAEQQAERKKYADRAVDALRRAVAVGFRDLARMRKDADLGPLRARPDFQTLVADLALPLDPFARQK